MQRTQNSPKGSNLRRNLNRYVRTSSENYILTKDDFGRYHFDPVKGKAFPASGWDFIQTDRCTSNLNPAYICAVSGMLVPIEAKSIGEARSKIREIMKQAGGLQGFRELIDRSVATHGCAPSWKVIRPTFVQQSFPN